MGMRNMAILDGIWTDGTRNCVCRLRRVLCLLGPKSSYTGPQVTRYRSEQERLTDSKVKKETYMPEE